MKNYEGLARNPQRASQFARNMWGEPEVPAILVARNNHKSEIKIIGLLASFRLPISLRDASSRSG